MGDVDEKSPGGGVRVARGRCRGVSSPGLCRAEVHAVIVPDATVEQQLLVRGELLVQQ